MTLPPDTFDNGIVSAKLDSDGAVHLDFSQSAGKIPTALGPVLVVPQTTILLLAAWVQSKITGEKIEAFKAGRAPEKKPRDLEEIKKFIDDLQKMLPEIVSKIRGAFPHPLDRAMETAMSGTLRGIIEEIISEEPTLREKFKETVKNMLEDAVSKDENWNPGGETA